MYTTKYAFNLNKCKRIQHKLVQVHEVICRCFMIDVQYVIIGAKNKQLNFHYIIENSNLKREFILNNFVYVSFKMTDRNLFLMGHLMSQHSNVN